MALLGVLSACASLAPEYQPPALPTPNAWPSDTVQQGADGAPAVTLAWADYFTDPQLQHLITQALGNNRDLRIALLRVDEARASHGIQRSERFPSVGLGVDGSRSRLPADLSATGSPMVSSNYQIGLGLNAWELDFWGRVRSLQDASLAQFMASDAAHQAVRLSLISQVADSYLSLRELDERAALTRKTVASRQESLRIFTRREQAGSSSKLELTQVETLLTQAEALYAQLEQARALQAHALTQLVGSPVELIPVSDGFFDATEMRALRVDLPSELLTTRPDIMAAEQQLRAANANIGAARAAFFPRITLTGGFGSASAELDGLFASGSRSWSFMPSLSLPIFDGGRRRAALELAEVRKNLVVAQYEKAIQTAFREVADALAARHWLEQQVQIQQRMLNTQKERARLAQLRYDSGATPYLEVLDAQRDLLSAEQQVVQTRRSLLSSQVALYAALGGGFATSATAVSIPSKTP